MAGGSWWYNTVSGELTHITGGLLGTVIGAPYHLGLGWHELTISGSDTEAQAAAAATAEYPSGEAPTTGLKTGIGQEPAGAAKAALNDTFSVQASGVSGWFVRGLKVLLGGILMILAVSHLTGASNAVTQALPIAAVAA